MADQKQRVILRPFTARQRRAALMRSAGYNVRTMPPWLIAPIGGWPRASMHFMAAVGAIGDVFGNADREFWAAMAMARRAMPKADWFKPVAELAAR